MENLLIEKALTEDKVYYELYLHAIWSTEARRPLIDLERRAWLADRLMSIAAEQSVQVIATGIVSDHVHMLISITPDIVPDDFVELLKRASSSEYNLLSDNSDPLVWKQCCGLSTVSTEDIGKVTGYVVNQLERHASGDVDEELEIDGYDG